jgi:hypothetical protein
VGDERLAPGYPDPVTATTTSRAVESVRRWTGNVDRKTSPQPSNLNAKSEKHEKPNVYEYRSFGA